MDFTEPRDLPVEKQDFKDLWLLAQGPPSPEVFVAPSAGALSSALSDALSIVVEVSDSGVGTYLGACMGLKPSGGFSVAIESARLKGTKVTVHLVLEEPLPEASLFQAITSPFAVAVIRDLDAQGKNFSFVGKLNWEVVHVGG
jgi:hypothetical protein